MSKISEGEWYASGNGVHVRKGSVGLCVACAYDPENPSQSNEVAHANAQLFAASKDLLAACQNYVYGHKDALECEADMRAAIAKAEGDA